MKGVNSKWVGQLVAMGFGQDDVVKALKDTGNKSCDDALEVLLRQSQKEG